MTPEMTAKAAALQIQLDQVKSDLQAKMEELANQADIDLMAFLNPPVRVVCSFDGAITGVRLEQTRCDSMDGQQLSEAIRQASRSPHYEAPPVAQGASAEERRAALIASNQTILNQLGMITRSMETIDSAQEVTGANQSRTVSVTYRGRFLTDITCKETWLSAASAYELNNAVIEASQVALQTIRSTESRR